MAEKFDLGGLFKQAQELQGRLAAAQQAIGERSVEGSAGGCMVTVRVSGKTGVEMEAMTAVSAAALTIYDMCKAVDREMIIGEIRLVEKRGGKSGTFIRKE